MVQTQTKKYLEQPMRVEMQGTLDYQHTKQHIPHTFAVPHGATKLSVKLEYTPHHATGQRYNNMLCLTLFDPEGCRGARHNNPDQSLVITEVSATPGYTPGKLPAGLWTVFIDTHRILPPDELHYKLELEISTEPIDEVAPQWTKAKVKSRGQGWYRGDLHGHTLHSDASWDVPEFIQYARDYKLDFVTLTDHNTVSPLAHLDSLAGDDLLTMGGSELTTYYGHALALGVRTWQEWRVGVDNITMPEIATQVKNKGGVFIIAHPKSMGDPDCTGCDWHYHDMLPGDARHIEIWNGDWAGDSGNETALELWYGWLNDGYRMVATSGTDSHGPIKNQNLGFNYVYAKDLTERYILSAIKQGRLYLSSGPKLELLARNQNLEHVMMGEVIPGGNMTLSFYWQDCSESDVLVLIINGGVFEERPLRKRGMLEWTLPHHTRWCVVEVRDKQGEMRAVTNPIFLGKATDWR
jgi:hypothetical protein